MFFNISPLFSDEITSLKLFDEKEEYNLANELYLMEDASTKMKIEDILKVSEKFVLNKRDYPEYGFTRSAVWGHFKLYSEFTTDANINIMFEFPLLDEIDLYLVSDEGITHVESGNRLNIRKKSVDYRQNIIPLKIKKGEDLNIYFRVATDDTLELPLYVYTDLGLAKKFYSGMIFIGMYYGIILVMIIYNLFVYISVRDKSYLYYVLLIICTGFVIFSNDGLTKQYLNFLELKWLKRLDGIIGIAGIIAAMQFSIEYLNLKANNIYFYRIFQLISLVSLLQAVHVYFHYYHGVQYAMMTAIAASILCIAAGISLYKKYAPSRFYLYAMTFSLMGIIIFSLKTFDIYIPFFTQYGMQLGQIIEVSMLSFALADRIRNLQNEKSEILLKNLKREKQYQENKYRLELLHVRNDIMEKDLDMARTIQLRMVSEGLPDRKITTMYYPMEKVGGDIVDILPLTDDKTGIFLGDVSGHGVSAALLTVMIKSFLSGKFEDMSVENKKSELFSPSLLIKSLNKYLSPYLENEYVSCFYALYNHADRTLTYRGASHPPPMVLASDLQNRTEIQFLNMKPQLHPIGSFFESSNCKFSECDASIKLQMGSRLLIYSDGLFDAIDYSYENSEDGLKSFVHTFLYDIMRKSFEENMDKWMENISICLLENRENWAVEDDISAVFLEVL